jgi:hypothetical protein
MRGSQKSTFPSFTFAGVMGLSEDGMEAGNGPKIALALFIRSWSASAAESGESKTESTAMVKNVNNIADRSAREIFIMIFIVVLLVITKTYDSNAT